MEPPVARSRGRPRKRRREDEENNGKSAAESKRQVPETRSIALVGRFVLKEFPRNGVFLGKVVYYDTGLYRVNYEDGDCEDLDSGEVRAILLNDSDFDDGLTRRKGKLEKLVSQISVRVMDKKDKGSAEQNKEELKVDVPVPSELNGGLPIENGEEQDEEDDDQSSDSSGEMGFEAETPPLPPPLQLPPSSGTVGVPDQYVSHLFAVYGFLRSFSTCLFLTPFTLDDFVGALNCRVANTLFDAIHVSLMRALRRHLETVSSEGSELASKCLRCNDWSLLDMLTWPVFVIQYLVINGYTNGPEWKGFYNEIFTGEYYLLNVSRKLMILQILCDDVLESEEIKAEINMRKETEVGADYDAEDIPPAEVKPRRVHPRFPKTSACEDKEASKFASISNAVTQPGIGSTEDGDVDRNLDECRLCGMDGTLLCCDGCPSAYHSRCIGVMKMHIPEGEWYCPECKINMIGPTIAKGTSLRGGEIFGKDLYGQLFVGACDHLLVLNTDADEFGLKYYNQNDIPKVLQVLNESMQHRQMYYDICMAALQYWNIPESLLPLSVSTGTNVHSSIKMEETDFSTSLLPPTSEVNHKPVNVVNGEYPLTTVSLNHGDIAVPSFDASSVTTKSPAPESSCIASSKECPTSNAKLPDVTGMGSIISSDSVRHQSDVNYHHSVDRSIAIDQAKSPLVNNNHHGNFGLANDTGLPMNASLQSKETKESTQVGFGKCERNITSDFGYMGFSYKPLSYINFYMHGDFAASAAAKLAIVSSEESRSEGNVTDQRKIISATIYLQTKAFSLTASRFFWPSSEKKLVEVPRERCGWCFSCKAPVSSKRGCMLNHAALSATKSAMKIFAGFSVLRSGEGNLPSIAAYIIYMEECLRGLIVGPFLSASYRMQWRKQVEQATTFCAIKLLLLELEENIRTIAFGGDWVKPIDGCSLDSSIIQNAVSSLGTTQKRAPSGRRSKKRLPIDETTTDVSPESFTWWRGGKLTKVVFQKAVLPKSMLRKAARRGGRRKISGIFYADGSEIPKRSRQLVWRVAVQMSRNASQLALQVRYLDSYLRWNDLIRPEQNIQDVKGQETEASVFRNANICDKKLVEGKGCCYGVAFGSQKHLPSRVMKNVIEIEQGSAEKEKYWFSEARIPLYLVKEYEEGNENLPSDEGCWNIASQLQKRRPKARCKDIFFYLTCKRDNMHIFSCPVCHIGVSIRTAPKCSACQGYCHEDCSITSKVFTNDKLEYLTTCKHCHHAKLLALKETSNESPTSPLLLQGQENSSVTVLKGPRPKCNELALKSARPKASCPDMKQVGSSSVSRGSRSKCNDQALTSTRTKGSQPNKKRVASDSTAAPKSRPKIGSWGIIWKKKNIETNESSDIDFRLKNILLKGESGFPQIEPVCHLCRKPYSSDLMYICCPTCQHWYHADAVELDESKVLDVSGFKCCKCRRIKSPDCPYSDAKPKKESTKPGSRTRTKKEHFAADSDSGTFSDIKEGEPATPVFPVEADPLLFSLSSVELVGEPKLEVDVEQNAAPGSGPQKLPVRRQVKREEDGDGSFGGNSLHAEFSTHNEIGNPSTPAGVSTPLDYDGTGLNFDSLLNESATENYDLMDDGPNTYFSLTELLQPDGSSQVEGADASGDLSGYLENNGTVVPEDFGDVGLGENSEPAITFDDDSVFCCYQCLQTEPPPDLFCEICGMLIHSQCSTWDESPSRFGNWRCGNCRDWQ